jgi:capsular polysaccharide biosynthesis protein
LLQQAVELTEVPVYPDQIFLLSRAKIVVSAYSSGFSNIFWMAPENGGVLEVKVSFLLHQIRIAFAYECKYAC